MGGGQLSLRCCTEVVPAWCLATLMSNNYPERQGKERERKREEARERGRQDTAIYHSNVFTAERCGMLVWPHRRVVDFSQNK